MIDFKQFGFYIFFGLLILITYLSTIIYKGGIEYTAPDVYTRQVTPTVVSMPKSVTFKIAGDFMFARGIHKKFNNNKLKSLELLGKDFFTGVDASVVNLEGAISSDQYPPIAGYGSYIFIFPRDVLDVLEHYNINTVSLANNHSLNNGWDGFIKTRELLTQRGIKTFGGPTTEYANDVAVIEGRGLNLVFIGVHTLYQSPDIIRIIHEHKLNNDNRVVVMPHWGEEYKFTHNKRQREFAHSWIDAGADLVVGAHPHVVQDIEYYKGVPIYYSLGNFLFDQTEDTTMQQGVQDGLVLSGEFTEDKLDLKEIKIRIEGYQPRVVD